MDDVIGQIKRLREEKNAVITAHYYTSDEIQQVADFVGDSFYLAKLAKQSTADIIVFCGVYFMGESAKILNPAKKVLMPDITADCPMAHMVSAEKIRSVREKYDDLAVVCYINSSAELKAQSDVCVTSSNAVKIVRSLPQKNIFFIPDKNLGSFVAKKVPEKNIILNDGFCPVHISVTLEDVEMVKAEHRGAAVLAHPECGSEVLAASDFVGSTAELIAFAEKSRCREFIVCTEDGVDYRLREQNPDKSFYYPKNRPCCRDMKLNTPEKLLYVLENEVNEVLIDETLRKKALIPLEKMLEYAK